MYDRGKNIIMFPHTIPGNKLDGKVFSFNDIQEGLKPIADFGLVQNSFFGGNVKSIGFVSEYGFYVCPSYWNKTILGFYIADPNQLTDKGKKVIESFFRGVEVVYKIYDQDSNKLSEEEQKRRVELRKEAQEVGLGAEVITRATAAELRGLIDTFKSGKSDAKVLVEDGSRESYAKETHQARPKQRGTANVRGRTVRS